MVFGIYAKSEKHSYGYLYDINVCMKHEFELMYVYNSYFLFGHKFQMREKDMLWQESTTVRLQLND